jgi:hypothetical protein
MPRHSQAQSLASKEAQWAYNRVSTVLVTDKVNTNVSETAIEEEAAHMQNHALFDELVCLKKGAQVMCTVHIEL